MLIRRNIIRLGKVSKVITLPKKLADKFNAGDIAIFDIKFIRRIKEKINEYRCIACGATSYFKEDEDIYCTACGNETLTLVRGEK